MHPFLNRLETWIIKWLIRSPRIGAIVIKQYGRPVTWYLGDSSDPTLDAEASANDDVLVIGSNDSKPEPDSMLLERLYHAPDAKR